MISIFLGAGLSSLAGIPLASDLFSEEPLVDRITRANLVSRVLHGWRTWQSRTGGSPEQYMASLANSQDPGWHDTVWYIALLITLRLATLRYVGGKPAITRHHLTLTSGVPQIEAFWTALFKHSTEVTVLTTNYDILAERGIRHEPRPRAHRPGFNYGFGHVELEGSGFPTFAHLRRVRACGSVPLLKLHGSISWALRANRIVPYVDCRPAIRGGAAIVAPAEAKQVPDYLGPTWALAEDALRASSIWIIVGYSLPPYDLHIRALFASCASHTLVIHVFDPSPSPAARFESLLPSLPISRHPGFPEGLAGLHELLSTS